MLNADIYTVFLLSHTVCVVIKQKTLVFQIFLFLITSLLHLFYCIFIAAIAGME